MVVGKECDMDEISLEHKTILEAALREGDGEQAEATTQQLLDEGIEPFAIIKQVLIPTLTKIGQDFQDSCIFLPELMMAGEAAQRVTTLVDRASMKAGKVTISAGTVVIGQAEGDIHDIGRNIVVTLLSSHGYKVVDLGHDVRASTFLDSAQKYQADIVGLSALMTTTLPAVERTINLFGEVGLRNRYKIIIGGGATNHEWALQNKVDGYAVDAAAAVDLCNRLIHA
jgi:5-methyltetrahydrofolate--homocysteine methyltransferase